MKKTVVFGSLLLNLGLLFWFKYINFTISCLVKIFSVVNVEINLPRFDIVLPVGISFFTFQALSYTMDVYRGDIYPEKNFFKYALFVSFFPQLVAGPIERSKHLLKQLSVPNVFDFNRALNGFLLMLWGFFLKIVLADRIAIFVDTIYENYEKYPGAYLLIATILFALQIYCDFAGYSTIAIGASEILGISLMENFDAPYLSTSVGHFWRRWHISLTSWFKDYLYIPLGGSRKGKARKSINKLIVFLVSGLWHGANVTYVLWGCLNGFYQVIGELLLPIRMKAAKILSLDIKSIGHKMVAGVITFFLIDFSWIFFRAPNVTVAINIIKSIFTTYNPWVLIDGSLHNCGLDEANIRLLLFSIFVLVFVDVCKRKGIRLREIIIKQDYWFRYLFIAVCIWFLFVFGKYGPAYDANNFIYFQF